MKKEKELTVEEIAKGFKNYLNPSLFLPIFYTVVFGLGMIGNFFVGDGELLSKILVGILFTGLIVLFWVIYFIEKKNSNEFNEEIDKSLLHQERNIDENENLSPANEEIVKLFLNTTKLNVISSVSIGLLGLSISILRSLDISQIWIYVSSIFFGSIFLASIVLSILFHKRMRELYQTSKESNQ
ncbi:MAG: hypothetical protein AB7U79_05345 [Candidatus Izemoplasmatales bacterium]